MVVIRSIQDVSNTIQGKSRNYVDANYTRYTSVLATDTVLMHASQQFWNFSKGHNTTIYQDNMYEQYGL